VTLVEYAEKVSPVPLADWQKQFLAAYEQAEKEGKRLIFIPPRTSSRRMLIQIIEEFEKEQIMKFCFGDIVVVEESLIGVVVKSWITYSNGKKIHNYDVYVRMKNAIQNYREEEIERYMVRHKYLSEEEMEYQRDTVLGI
jgi:hypothetical protein